jgi:Zn-dependent peptidase ImmA (M78 family)
MGWTDEDLHTLALKYRVSTEVILRRLLVLDRTTNQFYRQKREELQALSQPAKSGPVHQAKQAIIMNGRRFTGLVLRAYQDAAITSREVADYLGVRLKHLHEIESQL